MGSGSVQDGIIQVVLTPRAGDIASAFLHSLGIFFSVLAVDRKGCESADKTCSTSMDLWRQ